MSFFRFDVSSALWLSLAAATELAGCYAFWGWLRLGRPAWWLGWGIACLAIFAWALTRVETSYAGRTFAAYGGVYMTAALLWLVAVERVRPSATDLVGIALCLIGSTVILLGRG